MADQGKWFKLWESALDDQDLENLSIHEWFCWARFGTYLKKHGKDGKIRLRSPSTAVTNLLRLPTFRDVINMLKRFPNYVVNEGAIGAESGRNWGAMEGQSVTANVTVTIVTCEIICLNWPKYQGDFSNERVRKHRARVTANVTVQEERRGEEKRGEERGGRIVTTAPVTPPSPLSLWLKKVNGLTPKEKLEDKEQYVAELMEFHLPFSYQDELIAKLFPKGDSNEPNGGQGVPCDSNLALRAVEAQGLRKIGLREFGPVSTGIRDSQMHEKQTQESDGS